MIYNNNLFINLSGPDTYNSQYNQYGDEFVNHPNRFRDIRMNYILLIYFKTTKLRLI